MADWSTKPLNQTLVTFGSVCACVSGYSHIVVKFFVSFLIVSYVRFC